MNRTRHTEPISTPQPQPKRRRSLFWPGFAIGFLIMTALSCGGIVMATGLENLDLSDLQAGSVAWSPPPVTPTPLMRETPAPDATIVPEQEGAYPAGERIRNITNSRVNIRAAPGYLSKPDGDVVAQIMPGETVEILGGRAVADNLTWWLIRYTSPDGNTVDGWIAEATASGVQILGP